MPSTSWVPSWEKLTPYMDYIVAALMEGGEGADRLFDRLCDMTDRLIDDGQATGTILEPADRLAWVTTLVAFTCGASMLGGQIARRMGGANLMEPTVYARYAMASLELLTHGMFTDDRFLRMTSQAMADQHLTNPVQDDSNQKDQA